MSALYRPGPAAVLVGPQGVVATDLEHAAALVSLTGTDLLVLSVIDTLSGGSLPSLPEFASVTVEGPNLRVVVRGDFTVSVGGDQWNGADVATWREVTVPGAAGAEVALARGSEISADVGLELPVESGIVLAAHVAWSSASAPDSAPAAAPTAATPPTLSDLIQSDVAPAPPAPQVVAPPEPGERDTVEPDDVEPDAAEPDDVESDAAEPEVEVPKVAEAESLLGDHDGRTITASQLKALRERAAGLDAAPRAAVVLPSGERYDVAPRLLLGRRPQARQVATADVPTLVTVDDPYVSGTHLEVALQDGEVVVTDVSTNGTLVVRPGEGPQNLEKGVPTSVPDGTRLSLSDDLTVTVELEGNR